MNFNKILLHMLFVFLLCYPQRASCENIYISDKGSIYEDLLMKQPGMLWPPKTGLYTPTNDIENIFIDIRYNKVYWHGMFDMKIYNANIDGSHIETIFDAGAAGYSLIHDIAVDLQAGKIYLTTRHIAASVGEIIRMNLDGSGVETVISGLTNPPGLDLDTTNNKIYWTDYRTINRANIDGSSVEELLYRSDITFDELIVDTDNGLIYWNARNDGDMYKTWLDGSGTVRFYNGADDIHDFDIYKGKVYMVQDYNYGDAMSYMNTDGSNFKMFLTSGAGNYYGIDVTPSQVTIEGAFPKYYTTLQDAYDNVEDGAVMKCLDMDFNENLFIDQNKFVTLEGGYNDDYSKNDETTRIIGNMLISDGVLTIGDFNLEE